MWFPYEEKYCPHCSFKGQISDTLLKGIRYVECLRDNKGAEEHFNRTLNDEDDLQSRQEVEFEHCPYYTNKGYAVVPDKPLGPGAK